MHDAYDQVIAARDFLSSRIKAQPRIGVVLGSGLGAFATGIEQPVAIAYPEIPHWPCGRVPGHAGKLVLGELAGTPIVVLSGRAHLYEGFAAADAAFGVRVLGAMRVRTVILTNASGAVNENWQAGKLALLADHINLQGTSPLIGAGCDRFGPPFTDLSEAYDAELRKLARGAARKLSIELFEGVYAGVLGPNYETPAEIRYLRALGADMVGMSTVQETIAAHQIGMRVLAISVLTNMAAGVSAAKLSHEEVLAVGQQASSDLARLLKAIAPQLPAEEAER
jgi:purine-nucleoside phosphorylase